MSSQAVKAYSDASQFISRETKRRGGKADPHEGARLVERGYVSLPTSSGAGVPTLEAFLAGAELSLTPDAFRDLCEELWGHIAKGALKLRCPQAYSRFFDYAAAARAAGFAPFKLYGRAATPGPQLFAYIATKECGLELPFPSTSLVVIPDLYPFAPRAGASGSPAFDPPGSPSLPGPSLPGPSGPSSPFNPPPTPKKGGGWFLPVAVVGGGLLALAAASGSKKKAS